MRRQPTPKTHLLLLAACCLVSWPARLWSEIEPALVREGKVALNPKNCLIQWVGTHMGDNPDPRKGTFEKFEGVAVVDADAPQLKSVSIEIQTSSLATPIPNLTNHLKSPDFFDVREYPTAKFVSNSIVANDQGSLEMAGQLTLHGVTKEIRIPVVVWISEKGLQLRGEVTLDRTAFGMDQLTDRVSKEVQLTIGIGPEPPVDSQARTTARNPGNRAMDPAAQFKQRDKDADGRPLGDGLPQLGQGS